MRRNVITLLSCGIVLAFVTLCVSVGTVKVEAAGKTLTMGSAPAQPRTVYRIRTEEGVKITDATFTADEKKAIMRLKHLLENWPSSLWIASDNGRLVLVRMGKDGKPETLGQ